MRKGIQREVQEILTKRGPMTVIELAKALGYKTRITRWGSEAVRGFRVDTLEREGLVIYDNKTKKWSWKGEE